MAPGPLHTHRSFTYKIKTADILAKNEKSLEFRSENITQKMVAGQFLLKINENSILGQACTRPGSLLSLSQTEICGARPFIKEQRNEQAFWVGPIRTRSKLTWIRFARLGGLAIAAALACDPFSSLPSIAVQHTYKHQHLMYPSRKKNAVDVVSHLRNAERWCICGTTFQLG